MTFEVEVVYEGAMSDRWSESMEPVRENAVRVLLTVLSAHWCFDVIFQIL